jgi:hypothetical protein
VPCLSISKIDRLIAGLNLIEALHLEKRGPYWIDPQTFRDLSRIAETVSGAPVLNKDTVAYLKGHDVDTSPASQLTKTYAQNVAPLLGGLFTIPPADSRYRRRLRTQVV